MNTQHLVPYLVIVAGGASLLLPGVFDTTLSDCRGFFRAMRLFAGAALCVGVLRARFAPVSERSHFERPNALHRVHFSIRGDGNWNRHPVGIARFRPVLPVYAPVQAKTAFQRFGFSREWRERKTDFMSIATKRPADRGTARGLMHAIAACPKCHPRVEDLWQRGRIERKPSALARASAEHP